jgi:hypothetical protein
MQNCGHDALSVGGEVELGNLAGAWLLLAAK